MFRNRLIYRLFLILLIFSVASILPIAVTTQKEVKSLIAETGGDAMVIKRITDNYVTFVFYVFILAFLLSLFMSRKLLLPVRELHRGALLVRDGNLSAKLTTSSKDELGEVVGVFNEMVANLKDETEENIKLYDEMSELYEHHRTRRKQEHDQLLNLTEKLISDFELKEAMDTALPLFKDFFSADYSLLFALNKQNHLSLLSSDTSAMQAENSRLQPNGSLERLFIGGKKPAVLSRQTIEELAACPASECETAAVMPIYVGDKPLGILSLYFRQSIDFNDEDLHFLEIIASILAVAIERSEFYEKMIAERGIAEVVFNTISDGLFTIDTGGVITSVNRTASKMLLTPAIRLVGKKCLDTAASHISGNGMRLCGCECPLLLALSGVHTDKEIEFTYPFGRKIFLKINCSQLIDAKGMLIGAVFVFKDITHEKEVETMKADFIKTVSHEFRTPLSAIIGMTEMLISKDIEGERAKEYINTIMHEGVRLSGMVSDLLDMSRIESGHMSLALSTVDFVVMAQDINNIFSDMLVKKDIKLNLHIDDNVNGFIGDDGKIKQLLLNLIINSANYSDNGSIIDVAIRRINGILQITVSDTGWGIPEEDMPSLTKKFFRGSHGIKTKGTGLGLTICKEIARLHRGSINFRSAVGKGTTVTVGLPWKNE